jgi:protoporphyrinogen oxidase
MKIAIIGSGVSGLSMAQLLKNDHEVDVFEKKTKSGGLLHCERVQGNLFHLVGGHVFNSKNKEVLDWFWAFFDKDKEFLSAKRNAKIFLNDKFLNYPIENSLYNLDDDTSKKIITEILELYTKKQKPPFSYSNFETFLKGNFGETLFEIYFKPYNEKIWKRPLSTIPLEWLEGKLPMPRYEEMITRNILRTDEENMVHNTFFYPKNNGSQFIIDRLSEGVNVITDNEITSLSKINNKWSVNDFKGYDYVIYTGDVRILPSVLNIENSPLINFKNRLSKLRSNGTSNILCECDMNQLSWLYMPGDETEAHRIIYTGNFSESNNAFGGERRTCVVEFSGNVSDLEMKEQIKKLPGNLVPIATNHQANSYIIHDKDTKALIDEVKEVLKPQGIFLLGRFAEWEYFNMDACIESAMNTKKQI